MSYFRNPELETSAPNVPSETHRGQSIPVLGKNADIDPAVAVKTQVPTGYSIPTVVGLNVVSRRIASPELSQGPPHNAVLNVSPNSASKRPHSPIPELSPKRIKDTQKSLTLLKYSREETQNK
ncbi:hypothetical protein AB205_0217500 [Aquarana catesbeiana]|uniref:Uncharacterized protein n=1 Tax=Aquarana catesbeiana TaxID=8400 RepID=A0A2G9SI57_AQUCT|nr:hypothetical protein AB205_0217500 [Aquarana catesbeiana]